MGTYLHMTHRMHTTLRIWFSDISHNMVPHSKLLETHQKNARKCMHESRIVDNPTFYSSHTLCIPNGLFTRHAANIGY